ncbi:MAG: hypothetical protein ISR98_02170 [Parcubacteria group bacterium]|nr:hypothetical protein [Parcubacteria group bacterium]
MKKTFIILLVVLAIFSLILATDNKRKAKQLEQTRQDLAGLEKELGELTPIELDMLKVVEVGKERGLSDENIRIALQIIQAESGFNGNSIGVNWHEQGFYSLDIGFWQINSHYQSEIAGRNANRICLMEIECSTHKAIDIFEQWGNWKAWVSYELIK